MRLVFGVFLMLGLAFLGLNAARDEHFGTGEQLSAERNSDHGGRSPASELRDAPERSIGAREPGDFAPLRQRGDFR